MKDESNHHGAVDKSFSEQRICIVDANYILCKKNWTRVRSNGSYGRQVAFTQNTGEFGIFLKITVYQKIRSFASFNQRTASLQQ